MRSMTGCGRAQQTDGGWEIGVEIRTVNHRFLDLSCRLPRPLSFLEGTVRERVSAALRRGHVDVFLTVKPTAEAAAPVTVDEALARSYDAAARAISQLTGRPDDVGVSDLLPLAAQAAEPVYDEETLQPLVARALDTALAQLCAMREAEGENLRRDLRTHLDAVAELRLRVLERAPQVVTAYQTRLTQRLQQLGVEAADPARLAQEVALMADRCAIDEELARLDSHIRQFRQYLTAEGEIGKKLDFLIQEMNREANTIGSKANDAEIAHLVVDLKSEIEKLREQVQNVE